MTRTVIVVMMAVVMVVTIISVIITRPAVSYPDIYNRCDIPAVIIERIITPIIGRTEIRIIPSGVI